MKTTYIFTLAFILISSAYSSQRTRIKGNKYEITGKLINNVSLPPNCGYFAFATVMEFEIISTTMKNYHDKVIPVIVRCPEFYGENFFKSDNIYNLKIADKKQADFSWTVSNINIARKYNLEKDLWVTNAEKQK
ncbi:hypothetical protein [Chryseobacterium sp. ERMR1:04]|uniref:hypothetical protein n=1 Tax=Chryseobacterium sp. ERMR1:04 TaxID=1705393 RepID=UPI0006C83F33|nr:hypothetical protein [Chryseobacterium sp. ERMR1:04]KPH12881.1 hypothetical protein AMQ68_14605 [Chryseobacterium sp. ERMR1:04]